MPNVKMGLPPDLTDLIELSMGKVLEVSHEEHAYTKLLVVGNAGMEKSTFTEQFSALDISEIVHDLMQQERITLSTGAIYKLLDQRSAILIVRVINRLRAKRNARLLMLEDVWKFLTQFDSSIQQLSTDKGILS
ncbi:hypothetical protein FE810_15390 [Thalassotalea litorea]|uniref:Uncharacterized protein n=1 Tax=Thalassotalea litorea TaxID=2020715 RepID=A0A5R9IC77_9GAMM|nr:hypothetical protein [Thalassotalea litorea]TLU61205.1 hypothetical protein FE810_15390 [Thalassotalea litorea]